MNGLWLDKQGIGFRDNLEVATVAEADALIAVTYAGLCGTDLELLRGYAGYEGIPGHEFIGEVIDGPPTWRGKRVVADINVSCGECSYCQGGMAHHCYSRTVIGIRNRPGAFAQNLAVPVTNLFEVPATVPDQLAVLAEPLAAAIEITEQVRFAGDERILVLGAGRLAQLVARVLSRSCGQVDVLTRNRERIAQFEGATVHCIDTPGHAYDVVIECTGNPEAFNTALASVRPAGTIVLKSTYESALKLDVSRIVVAEIRLLGSRCGPMAQALQWLDQHGDQLGALTFETFALANHAEAFDKARQVEPYKVLFAPN